MIRFIGTRLCPLVGGSNPARPAYNSLGYPPDRTLAMKRDAKHHSWLGPHTLLHLLTALGGVGGRGAWWCVAVRVLAFNLSFCRFESCPGCFMLESW